VSITAHARLPSAAYQPWSVLGLAAIAGLSSTLRGRSEIADAVPQSATSSAA
jgi:hypothetical protein